MPAIPRIEDYRFGRIVVDGQEQSRDLIILPDRVVTNWWRKEGHGLALEDFKGVLRDLPKRLIVGTGASEQMHPNPETLEALRRKGIQVELARTGEAVRVFNEADPATTAAALHLTC